MLGLAVAHVSPVADMLSAPQSKAEGLGLLNAAAGQRASFHVLVRRTAGGIHAR
jgi:hypothetical protein